VVADEVRKLAERTSTATADIQKTIEGIQGNMEAAGGRLENVKSRVRDGVVSIRELVEPLKDLQQQAARAAEGLRELSSATGEQKHVSEQIARNTERIANSAELSHAAISQSRDTAGQLEAMAQRLLGSTARVQLT
jgi:methyl-accepting chemotaxis protein